MAKRLGTLARLVGLVCLLMAGGTRCEAGGDGSGADSGVDAAADTASAADGHADGAGADAAGVQVPALRSFTAAEATALGAAARRLRVVPAGGAPRPMAWAMVNVSCQERALALEYAIATAAESAAATGPEATALDEGALTAEAALALGDRAADVVAAINVTGPLVTQQTLVLPDGTEVFGERERYFWPYHHGAVLSVDGTPRVIDLSVGDTPIPIDDWLRGFVDPAFPCFLMEQEEFQTVWVYWLAAFSNFVPGARPERACGYTITPIFTFRWDHEPQAEVLVHAPPALVVQLGSLATTLSGHGVTLPEEDLPDVVSRYTALTTGDVCEWGDLIFCGL